MLFRAVAPGGTSLAGDADFAAVRVAGDVVAASGVGQFNAVALDRVLTGRAVGVRPFIGEISQGLGGGSAPKDLEALFQLIHLRFTEPRADATAFAALQAQVRALLPNQDASPDVAFNQAMGSALSGDHPRRRPETPETVARWSLDKSLTFYRARFANAGNFTFFFVGSFTEDSMRPLVETYLASLPAAATRENWRDLGITAPRGSSRGPCARASSRRPGLHRVLRAVRVATARTGAPHDGAAAAGPPERSHPEDLRATYSIAADSQTAKCLAPSSACVSTGRATRPRGEPRSTGVRGDGPGEGDVADRGPDGARARGSRAQ